MCFSPRFWVLGGGGGAPKGLAHNLPMQSFTLWAAQKLILPKLIFFDFVIT